MSTIEKAAARLVEKAKEAREAEPAPVVAPDPQPQAPAEEPVSVAVPVAEVAEVVEDAVNDGQVSDQNDSSVNVAAPASPVAPPARALDIEKTCELNFGWLAENGFLVPGHQNPVQAQEFRRIKRPLLLNLKPQKADKLAIPPNLIFVTSSLPAEGKTFVSLNLALSLSAELDKNVLLLDGDPAKGDLSRWMGIHGEPGLVDLLTDETGHLENNVITTNVDRLSVMPCGAATDNLDELFASALMHELLEEIATHNSNRIVVIDGPPLLATTEAAVLARLMGQVIMVVEANKTPRSAVDQSVALLKGCQNVSLLLNKTAQAQSGTYGYGYGYGYGHNPSSARSEPPEADEQ